MSSVLCSSPSPPRLDRSQYRPEIDDRMLLSAGAELAAYVAALFDHRDRAVRDPQVTGEALERKPGLAAAQHHDPAQRTASRHAERGAGIVDRHDRRAQRSDAEQLGRP